MATFSKIIPLAYTIILYPLIMIKCHSFTIAPTASISTQTTTSNTDYYNHRLHAKKRKNNKSDEDDFRWYDTVEKDATSDDVFWQEMERRNSMIAGAGGDDNNDRIVSVKGGVETTMNAGADDDDQFFIPEQESSKAGGVTVDSNSVDATLASFADFMVSDNWLDERFQELKGMDNEITEDDFEQQLEEWESDDNDNDDEIENWDTYYDNLNCETKDNSDDNDEGRIKIDMKKARSGIAKDFLLDNNENTTDDDMEYEEYLRNIDSIQLKSRRLEKARRNIKKASAYFARPPNELEGYDRMWVSAIDNACVSNLVGAFGSYGVEFADNFGDFEDGCFQDKLKSIEEIASYKARQVYNVTRLPCIASRTSFEIEPAFIPEKKRKTTPSNGGGRGGGKNQNTLNSRVISGYKFNDIGDHVDYTIEALKHSSEPTRVTRFRSCFCFYDGDMEIFDYGELDCDLYFANSIRTFIPTSFGIKTICQTLQLTFGLEYEAWMNRKIQDALLQNKNKDNINEEESDDDDITTLTLRDRILKESRVLSDGFIDVSDFMDSKVDVNLMDRCGKELAEKLGITRPSKILTIAETGLVIALPLGKYLQVPVVYARRERSNSITSNSSWKTDYESKTTAENREIHVNKEHIDPDDRILVVCDFISSGSSQKALLRVVEDTGAEAVGIAALIDKVYVGGSQALLDFQIPIESVVRIASVTDDVIKLTEE